MLKPTTPWPAPPVILPWIYGPAPLMSSSGHPRSSTKYGPSYAQAVFRLQYSYRDPQGAVRLRWHGVLTPSLMESLLKRMPQTTLGWMLQEELGRKLPTVRSWVTSKLSSMMKHTN